MKGRPRRAICSRWDCSYWIVLERVAAAAHSALFSCHRENHWIAIAALISGRARAV